jgi:starvation-inducible DNA-binding protein
MVTRAIEVSGETAERVAGELRPILVDMIALSLLGKQLHWNVKGPQFKSVHEQLDEIVDDTRTWSDTLAERMITLGVSPSGQAADIGRESSLSPVPSGTIMDREAVALMAGRLTDVSSIARRAMHQLGDLDLVSQDLVIDIVRGLEKHIWMLRSQQV